MIIDFFPLPQHRKCICQRWIICCPCPTINTYGISIRQAINSLEFFWGAIGLRRRHVENPRLKRNSTWIMSFVWKYNWYDCTDLIFCGRLISAEDHVNEFAEVPYFVIKAGNNGNNSRHSFACNVDKFLPPPRRTKMICVLRPVFNFQPFLDFFFFQQAELICQAVVKWPQAAVGLGGRRWAGWTNKM